MSGRPEVLKVSNPDALRSPYRPGLNRTDAMLLISARAGKVIEINMRYIILHPARPAAMPGRYMAERLTHIALSPALYLTIWYQKLSQPIRTFDALEASAKKRYQFSHVISK